jgi:hypothetical protein
MISNILISTFCVFNIPYNYRSFLKLYTIEQDKPIIKTVLINITDDSSLLKWETSHTNNVGYDERFPKNKTDLNQTMLENIYANNQQKQILSILLDDSVSYITKLELLILNQHLINIDSVTSSIKRGGLLDDYNFEDFGDV